MTTDVLVAEQLEKHFGHHLLWHIENLVLKSGDTIHLRGENGSGKTTLLKVLAGLQKADKGNVLINKQPVMLGGKVCYLHQQPYMFDRSVRSNLALALASRQGSSKEKQHQLEEALHWSGLAKQAEQAARTLSGGERQALAMARAWLCKPSFWLLDEPTASLDEKGVQKCVELVRNLRDAGAAILLTTHQKGELTDICDQTWWMQEGRLRTESID
ncbi:ABC transporter ATP-binding protein [Nitrincola schmidtii]|uniref:ABC transporter ATP-binding protein n=1 Tax=Nitrincola schmidtii TaxID=1730894 RepID=UPI00124BF763|nr:ABC transporter ATP-binding protein [Nitrincola schmidtii]